MGSRRTGEGVERVYEAAEAWVDCALRADDSLFTPGKAIWSGQWLGELRERFLEKPDESKESFLVKLQGQLEGSPPEVYQLMAEALYVYFLIVSTQSAASEARVINTVLVWSPERVAIPEEMVAALTPGICTPGQFFHSGRPFQVSFLIEFAEQWKEQEPGERDRLLADPWAFRDFVMRVDLRSKMLRRRANAVRAQQLALLHLIHPDTFEGIVNSDHKRMISETFKSYVTEPTDDVDRMLAQIRAGLEKERGEGIHFYEDDIRKQWDPEAQPSSNPNHWNEFVRAGCAQMYINDEGLPPDVDDWDIEIGRKLAAVRKAVLAGAGNWANLLKRALGRDEANFTNWCAEHPEALQAIWTTDESSASERVRDFCHLLPLRVISGPGSRTWTASLLLMGLDVEQYPPFVTSVFRKAYRRTEYDQPKRDWDEAALYEHALGFLDRFIVEARARGVTVRHRLHAQQLVLTALENRIPITVLDITHNGDKLPPDRDPWAREKVAGLAKQLMWEPDEVQKIVDGLMDKRQVIFQGPPGTGKTYAAKRIAEWCKDHGGGFKVVQFHPSYSYEDFVEGFRPTLTDDGQARFEITKGPLRRIAKEAEDNSEATYILVIDEINRGNVAKVLGELYFLLEYRDEELELQYSHDPFSLPKNLWFIGTMNTTDRSIALVDAALRRRFYFFGFFPDESPIEGLLKRWLNEHSPEAVWVADLVDRANSKLGDRHMGIGPSYFMKKGAPLDENRVRFIWDQAVIPYIEEQCFGDEGKLAEFDYERLKRELDGAVAATDGAGSVGSADGSNGQAEGGAGDAQD